MAAVAPAPTAFATVSFRNDVGKKLRLVEARFTMDGEKLPVVLTSAEPGKSYVIVSGAMRPGPHVVTARLTYQGDRGVFSYMKGYKLNVQVRPGADHARRSHGQLHRRRQREQGDDRSARKARGRQGRERREREVRNMTNIDEPKQPEETFDQPKPKWQADYDAEDEDDPDRRKADSAFDDLYIEVDESELESELHGPPPGRKA